MDEQLNFSLAAAVLKRDFYVEDLMTGTDTVEDAVLQKEMISLLECAGKKLSKWCSNHPDVLANLPASLKDINTWGHGPANL